MTEADINEKCICRKDMMLRDDQPIFLHLMWCPEGYTVKEYDALPWYKRIFKTDPRSYRY